MSISTTPTPEALHSDTREPLSLAEHEPMCRGISAHPSLRSWALVEIAPGHFAYRCRLCYPAYAEHTPHQGTQSAGSSAERTSTPAPARWREPLREPERTPHTQDTQSTQGGPSSYPAPLRAIPAERVAIERAILAYGERASWPRFPFAFLSVSDAYMVPYLWIPAGEDGWRKAIECASAAHLAAIHTASRSAESQESQSQQDTPEPASVAISAPAEDVPSVPAPWLGVLDTRALWIVRPGARTIEPLSLAESDTPRSLGELFSLAERIGLEQLWIHHSWAEAQGLPIAVSLRDVTHRDAMGDVYASERDAPAFTIERGEWDIREPGMAGWYYGFRRGTYGARNVVFPCWLGKGDIWDSAPDGRTLALALVTYASETGMAFYRSPGTTGARLLRALHSGPHALQLDAPAELPEPALRGGTELDMAWVRDMTSSEYAAPYIGGYDKHAAYLGACSSLVVGFGEAEYIERSSAGALALDVRTPGYWLAQIDSSALDARLVNPFAPQMGGPFTAGMNGEPVWYTTPTLALASELGCPIELHAAYLWREHHRALEPWYKVLRDARERLSAERTGEDGPSSTARKIALTAVKLTYAQFSGWLAGGFHVRKVREGNEPDALWRPDWRHLIIAQTRANLYRNILDIARKSGVFPFAGFTDCWYFALSTPDALAAAPAGMRMEPSLRGYGVKYAGVPMAPVRELIDAMRAGTLTPRKAVSRIVSTISNTAGEDDDIASQ